MKQENRLLFARTIKMKGVLRCLDKGAKGAKGAKGRMDVELGGPWIYHAQCSNNILRRQINISLYTFQEQMSNYVVLSDINDQKCLFFI